MIFSGQDVTALPAFKIARLGMAHVVEGRGVFSSLTVEENLTLAFRQRAGRGKLKENLERAYTAFPILGERRRQWAARSRAASNACSRWPRCSWCPPRSWWPTSSPWAWRRWWSTRSTRASSEINRNGTALVVVEQQVNRVLELATWAVVLNHGTVAYEGEPAGAGAAMESLMARREEAAASGVGARPSAEAEAEPNPAYRYAADRA